MSKGTRDPTPPRPRLRARLVLGLLLAAGLVALSFRSVHTADFFAVFTSSGKVQGLISYRGQVVVVFSTLTFGRERAGLMLDDVPVDGFAPVYGWIYGSVQGRKEWLGFGYAASQKGDLIMPEATHMAFAAPHWALATLILLPVALGVRRYVRDRRRVPAGHCVHCGYDLRASTHRCPECGKPIDVEEKTSRGFLRMNADHAQAAIHDPRPSASIRGEYSSGCTKKLHARSTEPAADLREPPCSSWAASSANGAVVTDSPTPGQSGVEAAGVGEAARRRAGPDPGAQLPRDAHPNDADAERAPAGCTTRALPATDESMSRGLTRMNADHASAAMHDPRLSASIRGKYSARPRRSRLPELAATLALLLTAAWAYRLFRPPASQAAQPLPERYFTEAERAAGLERRIGHLKLRSASGPEAAAALAAASGTRIEFVEDAQTRWDALGRPKINAELRDIPLIDAIRLVYDGTPGEPYAVRDGVILVGGWRNTPETLVTRFYDIRRIRRLGGPRRMQLWSSCVSGVAMPATPVPFDPGDELHLTIIEVTDSFCCDGGGGRSWNACGWLIVETTPSAHAQIERLLAGLLESAPNK